MEANGAVGGGRAIWPLGSVLLPLCGGVWQTAV
jgi:hypothetical protein